VPKIVLKKRIVDPCNEHWVWDNGKELKMYSETIYKHFVYTQGRKRQKKQVKKEKRR